jgi:predicted DsbA family dithiol-disulfide isomerase
LETIKKDVKGGLWITWKAFLLDQQNTGEDPGFMMWEHPDYPSQGMLALVGSKAAKNQGEESFFRYHIAAFKARHDKGMDIADRNVIRDIAHEAGLDVVRFENDMDRRETWQAMGEDHLESKREYDVFGVPTLVFGRDAAVFVKLASIPASREEQISRFQSIAEMAVDRPYLLELKRPQSFIISRKP